MPDKNTDLRVTAQPVDPEVSAAIATLKAKGITGPQMASLMVVLQDPPTPYTVSESSGRWHVFRAGNIVEEPVEGHGDFATRDTAVRAAWSHRREASS